MAQGMEKGKGEGVGVVKGMGMGKGEGEKKKKGDSCKAHGAKATGTITGVKGKMRRGVRRVEGGDVSE